MEDRVALLTAKQKDVLRLVGQGLRTYEVASELGISEAAVTERLREARRTLGVNSSVAAARMLAAYVADVSNGTNDLGDKISVVADSRPSADTDQQMSPPNAFHDVQPSYRDGLEGHQKRGFAWPVERPGRRQNDLTWYQILAWGLFIGFVAVSLLGAVKALQIHS